MATVFDEYLSRSKAAASQGTGGSRGGSVDNDILKRLGSVETQVGAVAGDVREIKAVMPFLATKSEVERVRTEAEKGRADLGTRIDSVRIEVEQVRTLIAGVESKLIRWVVATMISVGALSFSIAKFVH